MKFPIILIVALLASPHAFAQQTTILADNEATDTAQAQETSISLEGFNGGVSTTDAHDGNGGGAMMIQMLMPTAGSSGGVTPGPFVARAAVTGGGH